MLLGVVTVRGPGIGESTEVGAEEVGEGGLLAAALTVVEAPAVSAVVAVAVAVAVAVVVVSLSGAATARLSEAFVARLRRNSHASGESSAMMITVMV